jgi:hypothetical protein
MNTNSTLEYSARSSGQTGPRAGDPTAPWQTGPRPAVRDPPRADAEPPGEIFAPWHRAQLEVGRQARESALPPSVLRATGFLAPDVAKRVTDWFTGAPTAPADAVRRSYAAFERETARLFEIVCRTHASGGLGVRVHLVRSDSAPYRNGAELCASFVKTG